MPAPLVYLEPDALTDATAGDRRSLAPDDAHHLLTVLRARAGDAVVVSDGAGRRAEARLVDDGVELVADVVVDPAPATLLEVVHGLPKGRKLDEVVRVLTELGVDRILPVHCDRSPVVLRDAKADKAAARWRAVARSAGSQSRRSRLPFVAPPGRFDTVLDDLTPDLTPDPTPDLMTDPSTADRGLALLAHPTADLGLGAVARRSLDRLPFVRLAVGPESGWSDDEVAAWRDRGGEVVHLGDTVLRTEHAATAACAVLTSALGRMG